MIFVDVETQNIFSNDGSTSLSDLKVSFVGVFDSIEQRFHSFWEKDMASLESLLFGTDCIVGYNTWGFDYGVMQPYFSHDLYNIDSVDLMVAMHKVVGFRPKLDDLARANLGAGKIGSGLDAYSYWQNGEYDLLEKYCLEDVRLTYEVWKIGRETGRLKYYKQNGFLAETDIDWDLGYKEGLEETQQQQIGLL